ncbi:DNA polymerase-3 subunit epsilon [Murinocardiopsis flavida]|uniref:DNA polymerase-3 subunit epsilon n=1 Tax=Murinocardiopsis flavida TaxID=645275 RepID=A0A2P8DNI5_9ACTN|nr:exonuclease domain-containing protein [Murinocardiopsis flavida]PSK98785.1 DNA polymerase-3 subunit epsilon [Murinocardiopsis flavida]
MADTWTAIDFETANNDRGSACSVGLVKVRDGDIADWDDMLIRPPEQVGHFSYRNTAIHGITAEDVYEGRGGTEAVTWREAFDRIIAFADGGPLVAHNASFDMSVVRRACELTATPRPPLTYACTLALARRTWRELSDHRLPTVCEHIKHSLTGHHQARADAEAAARIVLAAMEVHGADRSMPLHELAAAAELPMSSLAPWAPAPGTPSPARTGSTPAADRFAKWQEIGRATLPEPDAGADTLGPLFGRTVCISGELDAMEKPDAWDRIADAGGIPAKNVTKKTDVLVVADIAVRTAKHQRAEQYRTQGQRIAIVTEAEFLAMLAVAPTTT